MMTAHEQQDLGLVRKYFQEDGCLRLAGNGAATGFGPITQFYKWMFSGTSENMYEYVVIASSPLGALS